MPALSIDGRCIDVPAGTTVLRAAGSLGIDIPTLCHLEGYPPPSSCLVCLVEVRGSERLRPACSLPVAEGMEIDSQSERVRTARRTALELMLGDHAGDCLAPCQRTCPARMDVPRMIRQLLAEDMEAAIRTVRATIALPAVLGRICPAPCEAGCRRKAGDEAVGICLIKRHVAEADLASERTYIPERAASSGRRVAIVGAGPAGLGAAYELLRLGHACTIHDANPEPGGALRYAVGDERLPHQILNSEIAVIRRLGAVFLTNWCLGEDGSLEDLRREYDAVLLATGSEGGASESQRIDGAALQGAFPEVFAAGGAVRPTRLAVVSLAQGRAAGGAIDRFLRDQPLAGERFSVNVSRGRLEERELLDFMRRGSSESRVIPREGRLGGYSREEALVEAGRCLQCACSTADACRLRALASDMNADPRRHRGDRRSCIPLQRQGGVTFEPGKCISCGLCVEIARQAGEPLGLSFVGRGFDVRLDVPGDAGMGRGLGAVAGACADACPTGALCLEPAPRD